MAGGTPEHAALTRAIAAELHAQLKGKPCRAYSPDLRVRVLETGLVEVLSPGTEDNDRGEKREHYFTIPSLREYLLVSQTERKMELYRRTGDVWSHEVALSGGCESGCWCNLRGGAAGEVGGDLRSASGCERWRSVS